MEQLKEENLRYKAKSDESVARAMSMMMCGQASLTIRGAFTGWFELLSQLKQECVREELLRLKMKCRESVRQSVLRSFVGGRRGWR